MKRAVNTLAGVATAIGVFLSMPANAQTADEIVEKHLAAIGGRPVLAKLQSRIATGTIKASVQGMDLSGPIEIYEQAPNKSRTSFRLDLSAVGAGEMSVDQWCDGKTAFSSNSMQGETEITGNSLQSMLESRFPTPYTGYKEAGATIQLVGKEKVGDRDAFVLQYTPKAGAASRQYFDVGTYLLVKTVTKAEIPGVGEMDQTTEFSDYREVDGVKVAFSVRIVNEMQMVTFTVAKLEHNTPIDDAMFSRPAAR